MRSFSSFYFHFVETEKTNRRDGLGGVVVVVVVEVVVVVVEGFELIGGETRFVCWFGT